MLAIRGVDQIRGRPENGAAAVEFALTIPILLFITTAGMTLGFWLMARHQLDNTASIAARTCALLHRCDAATCANQIRDAQHGTAGVCPAESVTMSVSKTVSLDDNLGCLSLCSVIASCTPKWSLWAGLFSGSSAPTTGLQGRGAMPVMALSQSCQLYPPAESP
ncbi:MAG: pilus assembly protein [Deltaproteobacteria bacterium]|nr:pilus assembly protein [Deltaproteobacteria bacterium]